MAYWWRLPGKAEIGCLCVIHILDYSIKAWYGHTKETVPFGAIPASASEELRQVESIHHWNWTYLQRQSYMTQYEHIRCSSDWNPNGNSGCGEICASADNK